MAEQTSFLRVPFQRLCFLEMVRGDGEDAGVQSGSLVVLGRGLGLDDLLRQLIDFYSDPHFLVLMLGCPGHIANESLARLQAREAFPAMNVFSSADDSAKTIKKRAELYAKGGLFCLSSRQFLLDVLRDVLPANVVTAVVVVLDATYGTATIGEDVVRGEEEGMEAFGLHLLKHKNPAVAVRVLSDRPERIAGRVERLMRGMFARELTLYPRFHVVVQQDLSKRHPSDQSNADNENSVDYEGIADVEELKVAMTGRMKIMQVALEDMMSTTRHDLLRSHHGLEPDDANEVDEDETFSGGRFDSDVILSGSFESVLQRKLERLGRVVSVRTKQIIDELRLLRHLALNVARLSPRDFCARIDGVSSVASANDLQCWLSDGAQALIATAHERWQRREVPPKWLCLTKLLEEEVEASPVLIVCQDSIQRSYLAKLLTKGIRYLAEEEECEEEQEDVLLDPDAGTQVQTFAEIDLEAKPWQCIILYDISLAVVRQVEMLAAMRHRYGQPVPKIFHVLYGDSVEEHQYLRELRTEKRAFERLIQAKASLVVPETLPSHPETNEEADAEARLIDAINAGVFSGRRLKPDADAPERQVVVDLRELRSPLPFLLHKQGFRIVPRTILIGDYLLRIASSEDYVAVERKSVSDLVQSLASGRLVEQATQLVNTFKHCALLIEFERGRPFALQTSDYLRGPALSSSRGGISPGDIISKLVLLMLHFPRLRLWWSSSPHATGQIFSDVMDSLQEESFTPHEASLPGPTAADIYNQSIRDALLTLPGITDRNVHGVMRQFATVRHVLQASLSELQACMEPGPAQTLHNFLHHDET